MIFISTFGSNITAEEETRDAVFVKIKDKIYCSMWCKHQCSSRSENDNGFFPIKECLEKHEKELLLYEL